MQQKEVRMNPGNQFQDVKSLRDNVINYALIAFSILGTGSWMLVFYVSFREGFSRGNEVAIHTAAIATLVLITVLRRKLSLNFKIITIIILIVAITIANLYGFGLLSNAKIFIAVFPIFLSFVLPFRKALLAMFLFILIYAVFGYLFSNGILTYSFDLESYTSRPSSWIIGIAIVIFASMGLLLVGHFFSNALISNYTIIEKQQKDLLQKEEKYRLLFESSNDAIFLLKNYRFHSCNVKTFRLFKSTPEYVLEKYPWQISPEIQPDGEDSKAKARSIFNKTINGEPQVFDWQHIDSEGNPFDVSISLNTIDINGEMYIQAIMRDISEQKHTETELNRYRFRLEELVIDKTNDLLAANEELQAINEELHQKNEIIVEQKLELEQTLNYLKETQKQLIQSEKMASIGILTSGIAHEINNPVNFISSGVTGLEMEITAIIDSIKECKKQSIHFTPQGEMGLNMEESINNIPRLMDSIRIGVNRTIEIVKGLRTFSRIDDEKKHLVSLNEIIHSSLTILQNKYKNRIEIHTDLYPDDTISCYPGKLGQLFLNLIMNSIQAIEDKGDINITTQYLASSGKYKITIKDSGIGIPEELQRKIFDPFFTTKPVGQGTGLGLSISHGIVMDHNGEINIYSKTGQGTEFTITLPKE